MDREANQENPSLLSQDSPKKPLSAAAAPGGGNGGDRLKRDEWSEGAVSTLLEAYENKWILRNRAKLKGHDWEDVAKSVSSRANCTKSPKTQTQCKNKIESMKKRYRSESSAADSSSWPLFPRLDLLLRGSGGGPPPLTPPQIQPPPATAAGVVVAVAGANPPLILLEPAHQHQPPPPQPPPAVAPPSVAPTLPLHLPPGIGQNSHGSNGVDRGAKEDGVATKLSDDHPSNKNPIETDSSTPALYSDKEKFKSKSLKTRMEKKKRRRRDEWEIGESIRWLAEVVVRSEQARMDTMRELERMRAEAEAKRGEMDLKRTEIIANTQLEIARLFAGTTGKGVDSSLRIGRS